MTYFACLTYFDTRGHTGLTVTASVHAKMEHHVTQLTDDASALLDWLVMNVKMAAHLVRNAKKTA